ncbi:MATE family efflux transporter [Rhizobium bangladeshense]|uniref:MATE family efflux transporter n=1 Tax=Rhizobium bangladeshense TaxID=1138189 RepID=UPI001C83A3FC|nr:MATE family efflux transporter [Rhizobium bangladeshense]MBX4898654.1 MATE family efflux transporter [Rhizobium bangladeshense]MBY3616667.1 MATE family efflux transporter [Rhizobium bangladeshense]
MNDMSEMIGSLRKRRLAPEDLASPRLFRLLLRLGLPAMFGLSINAAHHTINMVFVGMIGEDQIAAIMIVLPILMLVAAFGEGIGVGVATEVGRALGADNRSRASTLASVSLAAGIAFGAASAVAIIAFPSFLLFGATAAIEPLAQHYLLIIAVSIPLTMAQIILDFLAIAEGNARFSMWTLVACFALNIILDPIMIFGFGLGLQGVAIATILSQLVALSIYGAYHARRLGTIRLTLGWRFGDVRHLRPVLAVGAPTTLTSLATAGAIAAILSVAGTYHSEDGIAGVGIALRLLGVGALPVIGISLGAQSILSFAWGRGDIDRVLLAARLLCAVTSAVGGVYGLTAILFSEHLASFFTDDASVVSIAGQAIFATHFPFLLFGIRQTVLILFQAQGRPKAAIAVGLAQNGYLLFPLLALLPPFFGFSGLLGAMFLASALTGLLSCFCLARSLGALRQSSADRLTSIRPHSSFCP